MSTTAVAPTAEQELRTELATLPKETKITITGQESYDATVLQLTTVKSFRANWRAYWYGKDKEESTGPIPQAYKAWKGLCEKFNEGDKPAEAVEKAYKAEILRFDQEQERLRLEAQAKAEEEARKKEEADRAAAAALAEFEGADEAEIAAIVEAPSVAVAPVVSETYVKASNVSTRDNWKFRVTDLKALCKAIGGGKVKLTEAEATALTECFETIFKHRAVQNKTTLAIAGGEAWNDKVISGRIK